MPRAKQPVLLSRRFYSRSPEIVARALLGKILVHHRKGEVLSGRIMETEAYLGAGDPASHAFRGRTAYNDVLFGPPGFSYVYFIYGMYDCLNVSCLPDGEAGGVLFRALQPIEGTSTMARLRGLPKDAPAKMLTGGPGRLCQAFGITRATHNDIDLTNRDSPLQILNSTAPLANIQVTPRIGIRKAVDLPLRFVATD